MREPVPDIRQGPFGDGWLLDWSREAQKMTVHVGGAGSIPSKGAPEPEGWPNAVRLTAKSVAGPERSALGRVV